MNIYLKVFCYAALMLIWGIFAFFGKTDVQNFIEAIAAAITVLGTVHVVSASSPAAQAVTAPAATTPSTPAVAPPVALVTAPVVTAGADPAASSV